MNGLFIKKVFLSLFCLFFSLNGNIIRIVKAKNSETNKVIYFLGDLHLKMEENQMNILKEAIFDLDAQSKQGEVQIFIECFPKPMTELYTKIVDLDTEFRKKVASLTGIDFSSTLVRDEERTIDSVANMKLKNISIVKIDPRGRLTIVKSCLTLKKNILLVERYLGNNSTKSPDEDDSMENMVTLFQKEFDALLPIDPKASPKLGNYCKNHDFNDEKSTVDEVLMNLAPDLWKKINPAEMVSEDAESVDEEALRPHLSKLFLNEFTALFRNDSKANPKLDDYYNQEMKKSIDLEEKLKRKSKSSKLDFHDPEDQLMDTTVLMDIAMIKSILDPNAPQKIIFCVGESHVNLVTKYLRETSAWKIETDSKVNYHDPSTKNEIVFDSAQQWYESFPEKPVFNDLNQLILINKFDFLT